MTAEPAVSDDDFRDILARTRHFVRSVILPRESEIAEYDLVPDDIRQQAKAMGLFGYTIPQEWGGLGLNIVQDVELAFETGLHLVGVAVDVRHQQRYRRPGSWDSAPRNRRPAGWSRWPLERWLPRSP